MSLGAPPLAMVENGHPRRSPTTSESVRALLRAGAGALPFGAGDVTAGSETELQAAVAGPRGDVDLPMTVENSAFVANLLRRAASGDSSPQVVAGLERFLGENADGVWENSWVRFPRRLLGSFGNRVLEEDLRADKSDPVSGRRSDADRFFVERGGEAVLRVPVSYLLKLSLAHAVDADGPLPEAVRREGRRLLGHFLSDNTSPETFSFHVVPLGTGPAAGLGLAKETAKRFLLTQLLAAYANRTFGLAAEGQRALVYFAPQPPTRQKELNGLISDAFYRELFMSPCLSGWDRGEEKHRYMGWCHQVLSRSQLNAVGKLREAGIITSNLVVLPSVSNVSLANNGTHVSLGSRYLTSLLSDPSSGFGPAQEKRLGDLVIKVIEHFLPLFVGTYTGAPFRLAFSDFHPETALGFLPHELDFTHLRMLWRRWRKKADLSVLGRPLTPFGPPWLDRAASRLLRLRGDWVPDFRLLDYPVCLLSTDRSPALDGTEGNAERLKRDLTEAGIFDDRLSAYLLCRLREFAAVGFSGFEGRHYSVFETFGEDLARAAELQTLVTAYAFRLVARGEVDHGAIPDDPSTESERRQIFFDRAVGIPTFFVRRETGNRFLRRLLGRTRATRQSRRYPGYVRVEAVEYCRALVRLLREEAPDLVEAHGGERILADAERRLSDPAGASVAGRITWGVLESLGARRALDVEAEDFNRAAERFYRERLRRRHLEEALGFLRDDLSLIAHNAEDAEREALGSVLGQWDAVPFLKAVGRGLLEDQLGAESLRTLIALVLLSVRRDASEASPTREAGRSPEEEVHGGHAASVC